MLHTKSDLGLSGPKAIIWETQLRGGTSDLKLCPQDTSALLTNNAVDLAASPMQWYLMAAPLCLQPKGTCVHVQTHTHTHTQTPPSGSPRDRAIADLGLSYIALTISASDPTHE